MLGPHKTGPGHSKTAPHPKGGALTGPEGSQAQIRTPVWSLQSLTAFSPQVCPRVPEGV